MLQRVRVEFALPPADHQFVAEVLQRQQEYVRPNPCLLVAAAGPVERRYDLPEPRDSDPIGPFAMSHEFGILPQQKRQCGKVLS